MSQPDNALCTLLDLAGEDRSMVKLTELAIQRLDYRRNERVATKLLLTILAHEELAERIATGIMPRHCPNCRGKEGYDVYVPMGD